MFREPPAREAEQFRMFRGPPAREAEQCRMFREPPARGTEQCRMFWEGLPRAGEAPEKVISRSARESLHDRSLRTRWIPYQRICGVLKGNRRWEEMAGTAA